MTSPQTPASSGSPRYLITSPTLPLAIYKEVVTHLRQVAGVEADVLPQTATQFEYGQSQIGGLWYAFAEGTEALARPRTEEILRYYGDRFGAWQPLTPSTVS